MLRFKKQFLKLFGNLQVEKTIFNPKETNPTILCNSISHVIYVSSFQLQFKEYQQMNTWAWEAKIEPHSIKSVIKVLEGRKIRNEYCHYKHINTTEHLSDQIPLILISYNKIN